MASGRRLFPGEQPVPASPAGRVPSNGRVDAAAETRTSDDHVAATKLDFRRSSLGLEEAVMRKRELIDTGADKRYVRRDAKGQFKESDDVGKSLAQDVKKPAKAKVKSGEGDKGDRRH